MKGYKMEKHKHFYKRLMLRKKWGLDLGGEAHYSSRDIRFCFDIGLSKEKDYTEYTLYFRFGFLFFHLDFWVCGYETSNEKPRQ